jgi:hypothetical protein
MAKKSKDEILTESDWGPLHHPKEFINSPIGRMPLEIYLRGNKIAAKVRYDQTKEVIVPSTPPRFIPTTTTVDFGLVFENGFEIKGVVSKIWNGIPVPTDTEIIIKTVRPDVKMAPKLLK